MVNNKETKITAKSFLKKFLAVALVVALLFGIAPLSGLKGLFSVKASAEDLAASGYCGKNVMWTFDKSTGALVISGEGRMYDYKPSSMSPFYSNKSITSVEFEDGIISVGDYAFYSCKGITSIEISDSITAIGNSAFSYCDGLTSVEMPNSVNSIGKSAFDGCRFLTTVVLTDYVTSIGDYAFFECGNLVNIEIPKYVTNIGQGAFQRCYKLASVEIPKTLTSISDYTFASCHSLTSIEIPNNITSIGTAAFFECGFTSVTLPRSLTTIAPFTFQWCYSLTSVEIPNTITSIGNSAFSGCSKLESVEIPDSVTSIGNQAFISCYSLTSVTIPNSVSSVGEEAFMHCSKLSEVHISDLDAWAQISFNGLDANPLYYAQDLYLNNELVESLALTNIITKIKDYSFCGCSITNARISDKVTSIGKYAFYACSSLASVSIGNSVVSIGNRAFMKCSSLTSIVIPDRVTTIEHEAFRDCGLSSITIGNGVNTIGNSAFLECDQLSEVHISDINAWLQIEFVYDGASNPLSYAHNLYLNDKLVESLVLPSGITSINEFVFYGCQSLKSVEIPETVTTIGKYAFAGCGIKSLVIPDSVKTVYGSAFDCPLEHVVIGDGLTSIPLGIIDRYLKTLVIGRNVVAIDDDAFTKCRNLTSISVNSYNNRYSSDSNGVLYNKDKTKLIQYPIGNERTSYTISNNVQSIGAYAFYYCNGLTSIEIPNSVTSIGDYAFSGCSSLSSVTIPNSVTTVGEYAFQFCNGLTNVTLSNKLTNVPRYAFYGCNSLTNVSIPNCVTSIDALAFEQCPNLTTIVIPDSVTTINSQNFYYSKDLTIRCNEGSAAYNFAIKNKISYEIIGNEHITPQKVKTINATASVSGKTVTLTANEGATQVSIYPTLTDGTAMTFTNLTGGATLSKSGTLYAKSNGTAKATIDAVTYTIVFEFPQVEPEEPVVPEVNIAELIKTANAQISVSETTVTLTPVDSAKQMTVYPTLKDGTPVAFSSLSGEAKTSKSGTLYAKANGTATITVNETAYTVIFRFTDDPVTPVEPEEPVVPSVTIADTLKTANAAASLDGTTITLTPVDSEKQMSVYPTLKDGTAVAFSALAGEAKVSKSGTLYAKANGTATITVNETAYTVIFRYTDDPINPVEPETPEVTIADTLKTANATATLSGTTITLTPVDSEKQMSVYPTLKDGTAVAFSALAGEAKTSKSGTLYSKTNGSATITVNETAYTVIFRFTDDPVTPAEPETPEVTIADTLKTANATATLSGTTITLTPVDSEKQMSVYPTLKDGTEVAFSTLSEEVKTSKSGTLYSKANGSATITVNGANYTVLFRFTAEAGDAVAYTLKTANANIFVSGTTITMTPVDSEKQISVYPTMKDGTAVAFSELSGDAKTSKSGTLYAKANGSATITVNEASYTVVFRFAEEQETPEVTVADILKVSNGTIMVDGNDITLTVMPGKTQINLYPTTRDGKTVTFTNLDGARITSSGTCYAKQNATCQITIDGVDYNVMFVL